MYDPTELGAKSPIELHARRAEILATIQTYPLSWKDPNIPTELLQELAFIAGTLRRKNAGPPRAAKPQRRGSAINKSTTADLLRMITS
jgi:hypothetical protein